MGGTPTIQSLSLTAPTTTLVEHCTEWGPPVFEKRKQGNYLNHRCIVKNNVKLKNPALGVRINLKKKNFGDYSEIVRSRSFHSS